MAIITIDISDHGFTIWEHEEGSSRTWIVDASCLKTDRTLRINTDGHAGFTFKHINRGMKDLIDTSGKTQMKIDIADKVLDEMITKQMIKKL